MYFSTSAHTKNEYSESIKKLSLASIMDGNLITQAYPSTYRASLPKRRGQSVIFLQ